MNNKTRKVSKNRQELLDNTMNYYNWTNRATTTTSGCRYMLDDGRRCAIGMEIKEKTCKEFDGYKHTTAVHNKNIFNNLPKRLQKMGSKFLRDIQELHDSALNWDEDGLSPRGGEVVTEIREKYNLK